MCVCVHGVEAVTSAQRRRHLIKHPNGRRSHLSKRETSERGAARARGEEQSERDVGWRKMKCTATCSAPFSRGRIASLHFAHMCRRPEFAAAESDKQSRGSTDTHVRTPTWGCVAVLRSPPPPPTRVPVLGQSENHRGTEMCRLQIGKKKKKKKVI